MSSPSKFGRISVEKNRPADSASYLTEDEVRIFNDSAGREGPTERLTAAREVLGEFHAAGITAIQAHGTLEDLQALFALKKAGELTLRDAIAFLNGTPHGARVEQNKWALEDRAHLIAGLEYIDWAGFHHSFYGFGVSFFDIHQSFSPC